MSKELIERLRFGESYDSLVKEAVADRIEELEREVEVLKTTPADKRQDLHCVASDLCQQVREAEAERDALLADNARLREALQTFIDEHEECSDADDWAAMLCSIEAHHVADEALATMPSQSLAMARNQVREECAKVCDRFAEREMHPAECAAALRAMKEPE